MTFIHVSGKEITDIPHVQHGIRREWNKQLVRTNSPSSELITAVLAFVGPVASI